MNNQNKYKNTAPQGENKPKRYSTDSFVKELRGKTIKLTLLDGQEQRGKLVELGMYDILIQTSQAKLIVMKSAIVSIEVLS